MPQNIFAIAASGCEANERRGIVRRLLVRTSQKKGISTNDYDKVNAMQM
jgi:hypothetical protein